MLAFALLARKLGMLFVKLMEPPGFVLFLSSILWCCARVPYFPHKHETDSVRRRAKAHEATASTLAALVRPIPSLAVHFYSQQNVHGGVDGFLASSAGS